ncbi:indolepyruvate ferredoxin oxidoreductase alpha subunit [Carboxydocella sporoproducens DSM 16521]|uniref:Indolepyruvate oxidoreductase subunit IorA n=2 Tax=Carboxydocella TaxID=178898 RepID=A0A1T4PK12_9FIRM|nr:MULTISPECIES: indolepyruvate ferredoxin oxidoreductase subunit alpha [Carboxydocella]AVX19505.1 indolepyruvate ferredoxin oxidoreductase alpha subunit [Carboxydocella thermautotrophica]SJZ91903.1 indolepyruvate ferredoxin oxidoreductase alpha subunit [Carboxydocella sporoproducens DSM 16521]
MKELLTGNEAIARGAYEAGVVVAAGYPGTPSTEILENMTKYPNIKAQWSPNEKVALEVGAGAAIAGARTIVTMKHVGVNVAADPLLTLAYTGVNGGFLLVAADDPGMHSSQNEQDSRYYGRLAKIPVLEPADSQECKDFVLLGLALSEQFDTPVMLRTHTRIAHSQTLVELGEPLVMEVKPYQKNPQKYVMIPAYGRQRHLVVEERMRQLAAWAETAEINRLEWGDRDMGIITSGICYQYVREAFPRATVLKLGLTNPLPVEKIKELAAGVEQVFVVEELDGLIEEQVKAMGIMVQGKKLFPPVGELSATLVRRQILLACGRQEEAEYLPRQPQDQEVPNRPPVLCPGCPHRATFFMLRELKLRVAGDIGCYTLGVLPPLNAIDTCICMGASIGAALGMEKANPEEFKGRTVAVIGDSTFLHSGITGLLDLVYNGGTGTVLILDNRTTAMTGHQPHPGTGQRLSGEAAPQVDLAAIARACGVKRIAEVDPFELKAFRQILKEELAAAEPSVIIVRRPCALIVKEKNPPLVIDPEKCLNCGRCISLGCPAISKGEDKPVIDQALCNGCDLCARVCPVEAISSKGGEA